MRRLRAVMNGRAARLLLPVVATTAVYLAVVQPLLGLYDENARMLADRRMLIAHLRHFAATPASTPSPEGAPLALAGGSDAVAIAELQLLLKNIARGAGATVGSAEGLPPDSEDGASHRVGIRLSLGGGLGPLISVLSGIDAARPLLFVDNLQLRAASSGQIDMNLDTYAFRSE